MIILIFHKVIPESHRASVMSLFRVPVSLVALWWVQVDCINTTYDWFRRELRGNPFWAIKMLGN